MLAVGVIPVPDNATVPFAPTVRVPFNRPVDFGAKATLMVQEPPAANVAVQVLDGCVKSGVVEMVPTVSLAVLALVRVTVCVALVLPTN